MAGKTLFDKIWDPHVVADLGGGFALLHIDRNLLHDLSGARALQEVEEKGYRVARPELTFATPDHAVSTLPGRTSETFGPGHKLLVPLRRRAKELGVRLFDLGQDGHGIVHIIGPELGLSLPGLTIVCGDSHTCTHGGIGALAFGIGSSELVHVLATQTLVQRKPRRMRIDFDGALAAGVTPKDMILHLIGAIGTAGGTGYAVEYAGSAIRSLPRGRAPHHLQPVDRDGRQDGHGRARRHDLRVRRRPRLRAQGRDFDAAVAHWRTLPGDADAVVRCRAPHRHGGRGTADHLGHQPGACHRGRSRDPRSGRCARREPAQRVEGGAGRTRDSSPAGRSRERKSTGSSSAPAPTAASPTCAPRPRSCAAAARRRMCTAWVVPGSERVKKQAEAEGLDRVFVQAGFDWREPGCSMCVASNGETVPPLQRSVSTSNRNFVGRQGPRARTHLASPAMAAAAAIKGAIADVRKM